MTTWLGLTTTTIKSSDYMTDGLCHAILDYEGKVEVNKSRFQNLLSEKSTLQQQKTSIENELAVLNTELLQIQDRLDIQKSNNACFIYSSDIASGATITVDLNPIRNYAVMVKSSLITSISLNGVTQTVNLNTWTMLGKINESEQVNVGIGGTGNTHIDLYVTEITTDEYTIATQDEILNKYNDHFKQQQIDSKQSEINVVDVNITTVDGQIGTLRNDLVIENNFTPEQIVERDQFIIEKTWSDENYFDENALYNEAIKKFEEFNSPQETFNISIVNFLALLEEQRRWNKMYLGDEITIFYRRFGLNLSSMITEIQFDFENQDISLVISNVKDFKKNRDNLINMLYQSYSTSSTVDMSKMKWDEASENAGVVSEIINNTWDAAKRRIVAGAEESVEISNRGIVIRNPAFPNELIILQAGIMAISADNGNTWKTVTNKDGVVAERLVGRILAGQELEITNAEGSFVFDENGMVIDASSLFIRTGGTTVTFADQLNQINTKADETSSSLDEVRTHFTFSQNGLGIGKSSSPLNINISNEQMDFIDSGRVIAYINGQKMYISSLEVLSSLIVGNHQIQKHNDTITLIKYVGTGV